MERRVVKNRQTKVFFDPNSGPKLKKKKKKFTFKKFLMILLTILIFGSLFYVVVISSLFKVKKIQVTGEQTLTEDSIRSQVENIVGSSFFNQNILFISADQIDKQLKKDNYQIASTKINRIPFNTIKVTITEQKPSIIWKSGNTTSILAEDGRAYAGQPTEELLKRLPMVIDSTNLPVKAGEKTVPDTFVKFVSDINSALPSNGIKVANYEIQDTTTEIYAVTNSGYKIRLDTTRPVKEQITDLVTVLDQLKKQNKKVGEYIDLRINGKVFYK